MIINVMWRKNLLSNIAKIRQNWQRIKTQMRINLQFITFRQIMESKISIVMGSKSDWATLSAAADLLSEFDVDWHAEVVSAHRTPHRLVSFASNAKAAGIQVIIAGAGGAAHLPGMVAAMTPLPVLGVPVQSHALNGMDSLLSIVQMPKGVAVGTLAIGAAGAFNAGLLAIQILALNDSALALKLDQWRSKQTDTVLADSQIGAKP
jgi:5-(carboxyamino)imidazole ribonucleotide mutase